MPPPPPPPPPPSPLPSERVGGGGGGNPALLRWTNRATDQHPPPSPPPDQPSPPPPPPPPPDQPSPPPPSPPPPPDQPPPTTCPGRLLTHRAVTLTAGEINSVLVHTDLEQMWQRDLTPLLVTRYPGTAGSLAVQQHIKTTLGSLEAGWNVTEDRFEAHTPYGSLTFTNLIATLDPSAKRRLVLACHFDSKYYPPQWHGREFQGATDSAVPCAMMLELARALDQELKTQKVGETGRSSVLVWTGS
ncbi:hypothetical protein CRUP_025919 [Coryphaenoides rupestris]|nr:hypothetical protein CRUP_025919 [Coryphaenoides rupestris]